MAVLDTQHQSRAYIMIDRRSPKPHTVLLTDVTTVQVQRHDNGQSQTEAQEHQLDNNNKSLDLDGMNVPTRPGLSFALDSNPDMNLGMNLEPLVASSENDDAEALPWGNEPATATWAPMMAEVCDIAYLRPHS